MYQLKGQFVHIRFAQTGKTRVRPNPPPPPPSEKRPENARRRHTLTVQGPEHRPINMAEVARLRSMVAYGESQRQRLLVEHMKLESEHSVLQKVSIAQF